ncbi:hypothetical protein C1H46_005154 [Malus baccata]|uniref:Uncharacterized protein n=1 Tax=Malus baccata TaxID=106549 RepID=A0A540NDV4_MALBA|nr:hypothetical protein C1H46_005154 [Malus baccata]
MHGRNTQTYLNGTAAVNPSDLFPQPSAPQTLFSLFISLQPVSQWFLPIKVFSTYIYNPKSNPTIILTGALLLLLLRIYQLITSSVYWARKRSCENSRSVVEIQSELKDVGLGPGFRGGGAVRFVISGLAVPVARPPWLCGVWQLPHKRCSHHDSLPPLLWSHLCLFVGHQGSFLPWLTKILKLLHLLCTDRGKNEHNLNNVINFCFIDILCYFMNL